MKFLFKTFVPLICVYFGRLQGEEIPLQAVATKEAPPTPIQFTVEPKARALDYIQAFSFLRQEKTTSKVAFFLKDGSSISNVIDIQLMDQGSLLILRFNSGQGIKFRVLGLEEIASLEHL